MKTSILFCCLMIVGGIAFGQTRLTPDPGDNVNPGTPVTAPSTTPTGGSTGSSGGSTVGGGGSGGGGGVTFDWDDFFAGLLSGLAESLLEEIEED
ncbi:MAG TPA: hypothetical protein VGQ59_00110 [Cyclobacteriaceae bacterium]|nr:hypothetical protein [Cyclobacteriaceae bacterium]